jgi:pyruvate/2-oxoglutarate dehydrogenase complex dihydrolipoamide dehydrogenase (E3) component
VSETADVIVLGLGPGGEDVAGRLAVAGLDVVGIERELVGGECPYWGCVPSKMMIRAADSLAEGRRVDGLAGHAVVAPDWAPVARRIRDEATDTWDDTVAADRFTGKGGRLVRGSGLIVGPRSVEVDGTTYVASRALVINTGSRPSIPPIPGLDGTPYWTNRGAIETETVPASLVVLGGGAIGVELSQVFARFGSAVTIVEAADRLLSLEEPEASAVVTAALIRDGIDARTGSGASRVAFDGARFTVTTDAGDVVGDRLLVATGRGADLSTFSALGIDVTARALPTDERCRVADGVYALGDVTGHGAFTHMSMYQADIVVRDLLGDDPYDASYVAVPRVTFTDPEVGAVGLTEEQARAAGVDVAVGVADLASSARGWIARAEGVVKVVADRRRGVLVGGTFVGPSGGEAMSALAVAIAAEVPLTLLGHQIWAYPTFHRAIGDALKDLARNV